MTDLIDLTGDPVVGPGSDDDPVDVISALQTRLRRADRLVTAIRTDSPGRRLALVLVAVIVAFHYSLWTLIRVLGVDNPLAYLGLVPFIALVLAVVMGRPSAGELSVNDRYLDRILGVPLLLVPFIVLAFAPDRMGTTFWLWRLDLLLLPFFVAGLVAMVFGARTLFRAKAGILFLFIAWPAPFQYVLQRWLDGFTSMTVSVIAKLAPALHLATPAGPALDGGFIISTPSGGHFTVMVASQCSGGQQPAGLPPDRRRHARHRQGQSHPQGVVAAARGRRRVERQHRAHRPHLPQRCAVG